MCVQCVCPCPSPCVPQPRVVCCPTSREAQSDIMAVGIVYRYHKPHPRDTKGKCIVHNLLFERETIPAETLASVVPYLRYKWRGLSAETERGKGRSSFVRSPAEFVGKRSRPPSSYGCSNFSRSQPGVCSRLIAVLVPM